MSDKNWIALSLCLFSFWRQCDCYMLHSLSVVSLFTSVVTCNYVCGMCCELMCPMWLVREKMAVWHMWHSTVWSHLLCRASEQYIRLTVCVHVCVLHACMYGCSWMWVDMCVCVHACVCMCWVHSCVYACVHSCVCRSSSSSFAVYFACLHGSEVTRMWCLFVCVCCLLVCKITCRWWECMKRLVYMVYALKYLVWHMSSDGWEDILYLTVW